MSWPLCIYDHILSYQTCRIHVNSPIMFLVSKGLNVFLLLELRRLVLILPRHLDHLPGLLFCQYRNMAFICTRVIFGILCLCIMASHYLTHQVLTCQCGTSFSVDHQSYYSSVLTLCPFGGFHTIRHNEVRDLTTSLLTEVCHNVATEHLYNQLL